MKRENKTNTPLWRRVVANIVITRLRYVIFLVTVFGAVAIITYTMYGQIYDIQIAEEPTNTVIIVGTLEPGLQKTESPENIIEDIAIPQSREQRTIQKMQPTSVPQIEDRPSSTAEINGFRELMAALEKQSIEIEDLKLQLYTQQAVAQLYGQKSSVYGEYMGLMFSAFMGQLATLLCAFLLRQKVRAE